MDKYSRLGFIFLGVLLFNVTVLPAQQTLDIDIEQNKEIAALKKKIAELEKIIKSFENTTDDMESVKRQNRRKFSDLEQTITQLQNQVKELHSSQESNRQGTSNSTIQYSEKWKNLSNWRQLKKDMNPTEVVKLLGQPEKVDAGSITYWIYVKTPYGNMESYVTFINSKVSGWLEPDL